ncbi:MAG TPA: hypothetical protein VHK22_04235 [Gaiellaceae bacterium]|nr:hypothetical protein [Gaiellaceae bacterium]
MDELEADGRLRRAVGPVRDRVEVSGAQLVQVDVAAPPPGMDPFDLNWWATSRKPAGVAGSCTFPSFGPYEASQSG